MATELPAYDAPPVVETVLSAQFARLPGFTAAHAGWFWKTYLDKTWTSVVETSRVEDVFERFGDARPWAPALQLRMMQIGAGKESTRLQITRDDDERMIQVQDSRFIQNWRKHETAGYPSYGKLLPEFRAHFDAFRKFAAAAGFGGVEVNQWEISYVNLLYRGELWESLKDWQGIFPWFNAPPAAAKGALDTFSGGEWQFVLGGNLGRLSVALGQVKVGSPSDGKEAVTLQLTARGPIQPEGDIKDLFAGLDFGHEAIVTAFTAMTSEKAHKLWKRTA